MDVVRVPQLGMTMREATIVEWLRREGERVERNEPLVTVETDKTNVAVDAPSGGIVARLLAQPGDVVPVAGPVAVILAEGERLDGAALQAALAVKRVAAVGAGPVAAPAPGPAEVPGCVSAAAHGHGHGNRAGAVKATPRVRKLAQELGVDLSAVTPSGQDGVISEEDVRLAGGRRIKEVIPITGVRRVMAERMLASWQQAPQFTQMVTVDMEPLARFREIWAREHGAKAPGYTAFFVAAAARALEQNPTVNAVVEGDKLLLLADIHIGVAVDTPRGLVVPVLRDANRKPLAALSAELGALAERARTGDLTPADLEGATFTLSNLGSYGVESGTPVISLPNVAILFTGAIREVPVVSRGELAIGRQMQIAAAFDHRVIDGAAGARFTAAIKRLLENPAALATEGG